MKDTSPVEVVKATGERVRKVATGILDQLDTIKVGDGTPPGLDRDAAKRSGRASGRTQPAVEPQGAQAEPVLAGRGL